jgi:hypothetical protein
MRLQCGNSPTAGIGLVDQAKHQAQFRASGGIFAPHSKPVFLNMYLLKNKNILDK